ncbi:hypothetical protein [Acidiphilium acidophilum]|uniref:hypothetical protein n=1 Tax=Acidiphilium acidophilum TaxID=76588 RepID=UPI002E8E6368|nr:hypothetical protein [Acidiphilium acidophilum]
MSATIVSSREPTDEKIAKAKARKEFAARHPQAMSPLPVIRSIYRVMFEREWSESQKKREDIPRIQPATLLTSADPVTQLGLDLIHKPVETAARLRENQAEVAKILTAGQNGWTEREKNEARDRLTQQVPGLAAREQQQSHYVSITAMRHEKSPEKYIDQTPARDIKLAPVDIALLNAPPADRRQTEKALMPGISQIALKLLGPDFARQQQEKQKPPAPAKPVSHAIKIDRPEIKKVAVPDQPLETKKQIERPL